MHLANTITINFGGNTLVAVLQLLTVLSPIVSEIVNSKQKAKKQGAENVSRINIFTNIIRKNLIIIQGVLRTFLPCLSWLGLLIKLSNFL